MLLLKKPSEKFIEQFLATQAALPFSYAAIGATAKTPPAGYLVEHMRVRLGHGAAVFQAGEAALERWQQFQLSWVTLHRSDTPIEQGETVAMLARGLFGIWSLNACRIVYVIREDGPWTRFGFAYGTLPEHIGSGEERFLIEWNHEDDVVWYDILAFSRPHAFVAKIFRSYMRHLQNQFKQDSAQVMQQTVQAESGESMQQSDQHFSQES